MSERTDARERVDLAIKYLRLIRDNLDIIHDCGYEGAGKAADGSGRSQRFHYYGDDVGEKRWRSIWKSLGGWLGLRYRGGDRFTELQRIALGLEKMLNEGPPLTADEYNALAALEEKRGNV